SANPAAPTSPANEIDDRHILPPRISQATAERHGVFDGANGVRTDAAIYDFMVTRDTAKLAEDPTQSMPIDLGGQALVPYLTDPPGGGAVFSNGPGLPRGTLTNLVGGALGQPQPLPAAANMPALLFIPFGPQPIPDPADTPQPVIDQRAFRFVIA